MSDMDGYRTLKKGELIEAGDEGDGCVDSWRDEPKWEPATNIGEPAPDPRYPAHRIYRRKTVDIATSTPESR